MFNVNWYNMLQSLMPPWLRDPAFVVWPYTLIQPLISLYTLFKQYRIAKLKELSFNGQTMSLEAMLNYYWPAANGQIFIENNPQGIPRRYIWQASEQQPGLVIYQKSEPTPSRPVYIYNASEYASQVDFIVWVPATLVFNNAAMRARIDLYRAAGRRYKIMTF